MALHEPTRPVDLVPEHVVQQTLPEPRPVVNRRRTRIAIVAVAINIGFVAAFWAFLNWRPAAPVHEDPIPVALVTEPSPPKPKAAATPGPSGPEVPKQDPSKSLGQLIPQPPPAPAPDPHPPAPPAVQPPQAEAPAPPPLIAPPPAPTRAKTQTRDKTPPNLEPDAADKSTATHEAKPLEAPQVLSTTDRNASFAVPHPAEAAKSEPPAPAPDAPRAPTETEKLASALPTDMTALPDTFRAVLSGNGAALDAAYKGLVYGRFTHAAEIGERARQQGLKGQVIVAFTIDDDGGIKSLSVLQSSGNPAVDALGMEMIRASAPFPAPPPGAPRSFTPALAFGG